MSSDYTRLGCSVVVRDLVKTYERPTGNVEVLKGLNLNIEAGQSVAIMGASGVGKSTLLHTIGSLDRPSSGSIMIDGRNLAGLDSRESAEFRNKTVGFVFQFHHLLPEFTALENTMMPLLVAGKPKIQAAERAEDLLIQVDLAKRFDHRVGELSGGEQQRVALARALAMEPRMFLADEPTGNLDATTGRAVGDLLLRLNKEMGLTSIIATHNPELALGMDITIKLVDGVAIEDDSSLGVST